MERRQGLFVTLWLCGFALLTGRVEAQDLRVHRSEAEARLAAGMLEGYLDGIARPLWEQRRQSLNGITTREQILERQREIRRKLEAMLGAWPEKTPLRPQVTGSFEREGYRVEKVLYQSRPRHYVTANLYLPSGRGPGPFPGILGSCGHSNNGKASEVYQRVFAGLARLGFVVLVWDPPGQGERFMYYSDALGESLLDPNSPTTLEHTMAGIQCLLTGSNAAAYFVWDGIRGIDYLQSRPEVDSERIGVTGNSGGGTLSAYIAALDDRVRVAVPSCYITSWEWLWQTIGPQDAEQNLVPFLAEGLDFSDFVIAFAPKPYLINTAIRDFFPIRGARDSFAEARRIYGILDAEAALELFEADDGHGYSLPRREAAYGWFGKHFLRLEEPPLEPRIEPEPDHRLQVTGSGQVSSSFSESETIGSLNASYARTLKGAVTWGAGAGEPGRIRRQFLAQVSRRALYDPAPAPLNIQYFGSEARDGMELRLLTFDVEPGITLPALLASPGDGSPSGPPVLYVADQSKSAGIDDILSLARGGHLVLAPDLRGKGETSRRGVGSERFSAWFSSDYRLAMQALQVGRPLVGMRTIDIRRSVDALEIFASGARKVLAVGTGSAYVPLLHAAAFDDRIAGLIVEGGLVSWMAVVEGRLHRMQFDNIVPGALQDYDLPGLAAAVAPRKLVLSGLVDGMGHPLPVPEVRKAYEITRTMYAALSSEENLVIMERTPGTTLTEAYGALLAEK